MFTRTYTFSELADIRARKAKRMTNESLAARWRRDPGEIDTALWVMAGRTVQEAAGILNGRTAA